MRVSVLLTILFLTFSVSAQKSKPKRKIKKLPTVYEVAPPRKPPTDETPEWTHLTGDTSKDGKVQNVYSYQTDSLVQLAPHVFKFWLEAKEFYKKYTTRSLFLYEINCQIRQYRLTRMIVYDINGIVLTDNKAADAEFLDFAPDTLAETSFKKICVIAEK